MGKKLNTIIPKDLRETLEKLSSLMTDIQVNNLITKINEVSMKRIIYSAPEIIDDISWNIAYEQLFLVVNGEISPEMRKMWVESFILHRQQIKDKE